MLDCVFSQVPVFPLNNIIIIMAKLTCIHPTGISEIFGTFICISLSQSNLYFSNSDLFCSLCIFCGEKDKSFTEEGLDLHYWKHCPMLCRCLQCKQVLSVRHTHTPFEPYNGINLAVVFSLVFIIESCILHLC